MKRCFQLPVVLGFWLFCLSAWAAPLAVGDVMPAFSAKDQHGGIFVFTNGVKFLLVATDRACSKAANQKLAGPGAGFLEGRQAAYVLDIHAMPAVARFFALPRMRQYPQRIVLVDSAETLAAVPTQPGRVTVLALTPAGHIRKISFWNPAIEPVAGYLQ